MNASLDRIKSYLADVAAQWKTGAATELSYRAALAALLADLIPRVTVVNEPAHIACGAPDLLVRSNGATHAPVGYVETKDIGDGDLDGNGRNKEQFDRYKQDLDNIVFTDYLDFRFYGTTSWTRLSQSRQGDESFSLDAFETNASTGRVYVNDSQYFDNVPQSAWEFFIGGYQPAQKWLKDRKGRVLSPDDIVRYKSIILALLESRRLMDGAEEEYHHG